MVNQVTVHLKRCNPDVCRFKDRKTLEVSYEDEHRWLQADKVLKVNLQSGVLHTSLRKISEFKMQRKLIRSWVQKNNDYYDDVRTSHRAHRCESWLAPASSSYLKTGWQQTLSILILSKAYPTLGILSPLSRHARLFGSGVLLLKCC